MKDIVEFSVDFKDVGIFSSTPIISQFILYLSVFNYDGTAWSDLPQTVHIGSSLLFWPQALTAGKLAPYDICKVYTPVTCYN
jgi:hypothetical protein